MSFIEDENNGYVTGSVYGDIDMTLHDIAQYLIATLDGAKDDIYKVKVPWDNPDDGLFETTNPQELLRRCRMVKDLAIQVSGGQPLEWGLGN